MEYGILAQRLGIRNPLFSGISDTQLCDIILQHLGTALSRYAAIELRIRQTNTATTDSKTV